MGSPKTSCVLELSGATSDQVTAGVYNRICAPPSSVTLARKNERLVDWTALGLYARQLDSL